MIHYNCNELLTHFLPSSNMDSEIGVPGMRPAMKRLFKSNYLIPKFFNQIAVLKLPHIPHVTFLHGQFNLDAYDDALFTRYNVAFPQAVRGALIKRKADYFAGRYLCRCLLSERGLPLQVDVGRHREPLWPQGWIGSITHSHDTVVVALAQDLPGRILGIDLERLMSSTEATEVKNIVALPNELENLTGNRSSETLLTIIFSAKESLFKALYPRIKKYFDFDCAILLHLDEVGGCFTIRLERTLAGSWSTGTMIKGKFLFFGSQILTVVAAG